MSSSLAIKRFHGVRLRFRTAGSYEYVHWAKFVDGIIQLLVLCRLPMQLVRFIATNMLGRLSSIYSRVINEPFGIREQVGGLATRLMANSATYLDLTDEQDSVGCWGISMSRMQERLSALLSHQKDLDRNEITAMTTFCYKSVLEWQLTRRSGAQEVANFVAKDLRFNHTDDHVGVKLITEEEYGEAMTNNESLGFHDVVGLFDRDRKLTCFERIFSPSYLIALHNRPEAENVEPERTSDQQQELQMPAHEADSPESLAIGEQARRTFVSQQSTRMSSLETQKDEVRQNAIRIRALEEKNVSLEEQVTQLSLKYWELVRSLSEQEEILAPMLRADKGSSNTSDSLEFGMIEKQLEKKMEAQLEQWSTAFNQQLEKLTQQLEKQDSQLSSSVDNLQDEVEALNMRHKALDMQLGSLYCDDLVVSMDGNKAPQKAMYQSSRQNGVDSGHEGTAVNSQGTPSVNNNSISIDEGKASWPGSKNSNFPPSRQDANVAQTVTSQAKVETSAAMEPGMKNAEVVQKNRQCKENKEQHASQHSSKGECKQPLSSLKRWII